MYINDILFKIEQLERQLKEIVSIIEDSNYSETHRLKTAKERLKCILIK